MPTTRSLFAVPLIALTLGLAACGDDDDGETAATEEAAPVSAEIANPDPPPLVGGFYDGDDVNYLLTDVSVEEEAKGLSEATGYPVAFVPSLGDVPDNSTANLYLFMNGVKGLNPFGFQANVLDSVPGDPEYSPLWRVQAVTWKDEAAARELRSEDEVLDAEKAGEVTVEETPLVKNSPVVVSAG
jgi:hypothetical protein